MVNGSLGKTVNTKHVVQLPKSSTVLEQKQDTGESGGVTKDAQQDFSNDVALWP